jgi:hypothetical protein
LVSLGAVVCLVAQTEAARYLRWVEIEPLLPLFAAAGDKLPNLADASQWDAWIRQRDREVRSRIDRGVEDSISNLIVFGTSFTTLPRLASPEAAIDAAGDLTPVARRRVDAFVQAIRTLDTERFRFVREFMRGRVTGDKISAFVAGNLRRFAQEQSDYQRALQAANSSGDAGRTAFVRSTLFESRGLSVDTSLLPNYAIEDTLRVMKQKAALPSRIRTIAVIGPGLDFTDKRDGYDFYPLQTIQPFAVMETVLRLGLAKPDELRVVAFDLNPAVLAHVKRLSERAKTGQPYTLQLPRDPAAGWNEAVTNYWRRFGEFIGAPANPLPTPAGLRGLELRAVAVKPQFAARLSAADLNIVAQTIDPPPEQGFDLVVATNILVYYSRFEQALAMTSVVKMMNSGGIFLSNTVLPAQRPDGLGFLGRRTVAYSAAGAYGDDVVVYRRQ